MKTKKKKRRLRLTNRPNRLARMSVERGITFDAIAAAIGKSPATISVYASGDANPPMYVARDIARFLGTTIEDIWP